ncbi:MAG: hypothetical protein H0V53_09195 [Rubrobacter sp.]|nr:hypothetical protein [Rubrobacter sp.]
MRLQTSDDFRFVRASWEVAPANVAHNREETLEGKRWVPFAKGGEFSPYYSDVHLLVNWEREGEEIKSFVDSNGNLASRPQNTEFYFRPGLTWPLRTTSGISFRPLPDGGIFGHKGPAAFSPEAELPAFLALMNSRLFGVLVSLHMGAADAAARSYEVGVIQRTPVPDLSGAEAEPLGELALRCVDLKRGLDTADETSHAFTLPALLQVEGDTLAERVAGWRGRVSGAERELAESQREIDDISFRLYGVPEEDRREIEAGEVPVHTGAALEAEDLAADLVSYALGCAFGRWDVRAALDPSLPPDLADPFAPLPVCPPGALVGPDGLPARTDAIASREWLRARPDAISDPPEGSVQTPYIPDAEYPLEVDRDGGLADDPDHADDVVRRVREALELVLGERAEDVERELCGALGVKDLRSYLRNPRKLFDEHVKRYSRSRRKAPIYWLLQSPGKVYGLWIHYHRLDPDLLFKALHRYVQPRIRLEETRLEESRSRRAAAEGREARGLDREIERQETLLADVREFRDRLDRAARLYLEPDLNDGVALNIAPLREVVPWNEAGKRWQELLRGEHAWSSIARQLRRKGLV